ncbi:hypothetical protein JEQ12_019084 [Ovis aries]|uniref:Uncharacterized protein n=1 Tax=Ovis aries TaxID=9940 RepID=A0A836AAG0_SHEEP|nr:hypothetical protein JEQ12_019084 [Ovis aries]
MHHDSCSLDCKVYVDNLGNNDGRILGGCQVRVELSNGEKRSQNCAPPPSWGHCPRDDYWRKSFRKNRRKI